MEDILEKLIIYWVSILRFVVVHLETEYKFCATFKI